jgi:hypothetical protein
VWRGCCTSEPQERGDDRLPRDKVGIDARHGSAGQQARGQHHEARGAGVVEETIPCILGIANSVREEAIQAQPDAEMGAVLETLLQCKCAPLAEPPVSFLSADS